MLNDTFFDFSRETGAEAFRAAEDAVRTYQPCDHHSPEKGYPNPTVSQGLAQFTACVMRHMEVKRRARILPQNVFILAVDGSSAVMMAAARDYLFLARCHTMLFDKQDTQVWGMYNGDRARWGLKPPRVEIPLDAFVIFLDDYYCSGRALRCVKEILGRDVDLYCTVSFGGDVRRNGATPHCLKGEGAVEFHSIEAMLYRYLHSGVDSGKRGPKTMYNTPEYLTGPAWSA